MIEMQIPRDWEGARENARRNSEAAALSIKASMEAIQPVALGLADQFKSVTEQARQLLDALAVVLPPRRRPARKPCAWCTDRVKRPATHVVKWHELVLWSQEDGGGMVPAGRRQIMCEFHAGVASRYSGVKVYRFRRLP